MKWARCNILTLSGILLAVAAFCAELVDAVPNDLGIELAKWAFIATAAARGLVRAAEELGKPPAGAVIELAPHVRDAVEDGVNSAIRSVDPNFPRPRGVQ